MNNNPHYAVAQHLHTTLNSDLINTMKGLNKSVGDIENIIDKCDSVVDILNNETPLIETIMTHILPCKRALRNAIGHMETLLDEAKECETTVVYRETYY